MKKYIGFEEPLLLHACKEARREWITALDCHTYSPISQGRKNYNNHNARWCSPETTILSPLWNSADSEDEIARTRREVRQTSPATEAWNALLCLLRYEPRGHLTCPAKILPGLACQGLED